MSAADRIRQQAGFQAPAPGHVMGLPEQTRHAANPFDVLGIPRNTTDESIVEDAYRKWARILHPDRGGDPRRFQAVSSAYENIVEQLRVAKTESFELLKGRAQSDLRGDYTAANPMAAPLGHGKGFDQRAFNEVFSEHRMWDPTQDGYGEHMVSSSHKVASPSEMLRARDQDIHIPLADGLKGQFNDKTFNRHFDTYAPGQFEPRPDKSTAMVRRVEPEVMEVFKTSTSMAGSLSYEKVDDYSSPFAASGGGGGGAFTDYMKAFSVDALITPHVANVESQGGYTSVEELQSQRSQISFTADPELLEAKNAQDAAERERDELRYRNFLKQQEQVEDQYLAIRNRLPERHHAK